MKNTKESEELTCMKTNGGPFATPHMSPPFARLYHNLPSRHPTNSHSRNCVMLLILHIPGLSYFVKHLPWLFRIIAGLCYSKEPPQFLFRYMDHAFLNPRILATRNPRTNCIDRTVKTDRRVNANRLDK